MSKFNDHLNEALKYNADQSTVDNLLSQLSSDEHAATRLGSGDHTLRLVAADALQENGREPEANLLRKQDQHVMVHEGKVVPARRTFRTYDGYRFFSPPLSNPPIWTDHDVDFDMVFPHTEDGRPMAESGEALEGDFGEEVDPNHPYSKETASE
jgi:uncharacterized protein (TIGR02996 family)